MAKAIDYIPETYDLGPSRERKLAEAPVEHADAILSAFEIMEEARRKQVLDFLHAVIGAKTEIFVTLADFGSKPVSVNAARNLIVLAKALGTIDPELVTNASKNVSSTISGRKKKDPPPSLWQLFRRANHPEVRRGMSFLLEITGAIGRAVE